MRYCLLLPVIALLSIAQLASALGSDGMEVDGMVRPARAFDHDGDGLDDALSDLPGDAPFMAFVHAMPGAEVGTLAQELEACGAEVLRSYSIAPICSVRFHSITEARDALFKGSVSVIELQREVVPHLDVSSASVRSAPSSVYSPKTARDMGYNGTGVTIAILDSGVDNEHITFRGAFVAGADFTLPDTPLSPRDGSYDPDDRVGHGTAVASVALGRGDADGIRPGVAPGAGLIDLKVLATRPSGIIPASQNLLDALQWCLDNRETDWPGPCKGVQVVSLSVAIGAEGGALYNAINTTVGEGVVVVQSAGNSASSYEDQTETSWPDRSVIVSGLDDANTIDRDDDLSWDQSTYGPRTSDGDNDPYDELKPDVSAPGVNIEFAAYSSLSTLQAANGWTSGSGTSFSAPHVAGVAALMLQARPEIAPSQGKNPLKLIIHRSSEAMGTPSSPTLSDRFDVRYGWGSLDAYESVRSGKVWTGANTGPEIKDIEISPSTVTVGSVCRIELQAVDPDEEPLNYALTATGGKVEGTGPVWQWTAPVSPGSYSLTFKVSDPSGASADRSADVSVLEGPPNRPPEITMFKASPTQVRTGGTAVLTVSAKDLDGDPITYSYSALLGSVTGSSDTATYKAPDLPGTDKVTAMVMDSKGAYSTRELEIRVVSSQQNKAPSIMFMEVVPNVVNTENRDGQFVLRAEVSDPDGASDIKYVLADLSTVGYLSGQELKDDGNPPDEAAGDLVYSILLPDVGQLKKGEYSIEVTVVDMALASSAQSVQLIVDIPDEGDTEKGRVGWLESLAGPMLVLVMIGLVVLVIIVVLAVSSKNRKKEAFIAHPDLPRVRFRPSGPAPGAAPLYGYPTNQQPIQAGPVPPGR
ncbi:MAG: S8 family serine peptidase [Candidatus Thermoplasmatota archaeon]|jgi:serine protease AprX|nr:S8 family serine peptidase [Candidatus Thermoplasmatota archaeon]